MAALHEDQGIATTVLIKSRSAYTWLDKLRFLKGLLPQDPNLDFPFVREPGSRDSHEVYKCSDFDVIGLEETRKVLFNAKEKVSRKSRKLCFLPKSTEQISKEVKHFMGQSAEGKPNCPGNERLQFWDHSIKAEDAAVGSVNGASDEDRLWTSSASGRSGEALTSTLSPKPTMLQRLGGEYPLFKRNGRITRANSLGTELAACNDTSKSAVTRNRRSSSDVASHVASKAQKIYKFDDTRIVAQGHKQQRSGLKRRQSSEENSTTLGKDQLPSPPVVEPASDNSKKQPTQVSELASDHPSKRPSDSLVYITYQVFLEAGRGGLTAREAASRIEEAGLGGVFQGLVKPRIKIGKIIRNNPYYFQAGEGRYILCEAIVGVTQPTQSPVQQFSSDTIVHEKPSSVKTDVRKEAAAMARREGTARYWAQMNANGRARLPKNRQVRLGANRHKLPPVYVKSDESCLTTKGADESLNWEEKAGKDESEGLVQAHSKPRLKGMYKTAVGGKPCKRSDGKNWQCPLLAPPNSNYCEHHQKRMKDTAEA